MGVRALFAALTSQRSQPTEAQRRGRVFAARAARRSAGIDAFAAVFATGSAGAFERVVALVSVDLRVAAVAVPGDAVVARTAAKIGAGTLEPVAPAVAAKLVVSAVIEQVIGAVTAGFWPGEKNGAGLWKNRTS